MNYTTNNRDSWMVFMKGKNEIIVDAIGRVDHVVTARGKVYMTENGEKWVDDHGLRDELNSWIEDRAIAFREWRHHTPHYSFYCDGGSLAVKVGDAVLRVGCGGDGHHRLYLVEGDLPAFFNPLGFSLDNCTFKPLDYDYEGGKEICTITAKSAWFYRSGDDIAILVEK